MFLLDEFGKMLGGILACLSLVMAQRPQRLQPPQRVSVIVFPCFSNQLTDTNRTEVVYSVVNYYQELLISSKDSTLFVTFANVFRLGSSELR